MFGFRRRALAAGRVGWRRARVPILVAVAASALTGVATAGISTLANPGHHPAPGVGHAGQAPPDVVLYNGKVSTVDAQNSVVEAVAIRDGEILATGRSGPVKALAKRGTQVIDLHGRRVLPGIIDGHLHGLRNGYHCFTQTVRLDNVLSRQQALAAYAAKADELADGQWIFTTSGYNVDQLDDPGMFTLAELDQVAPDNPVWIGGVIRGFSGVQVNSAALEAAGLEAGMPGVVVDADGDPTGQLQAPARDLAGAKLVAQMDSHSIDEQAKCLADFIDTENALGGTAWNDPVGNLQPFDSQGGCREFTTGLHAYQAVTTLWREGELNARIAFHMMPNFSGLEQVLADTRHGLSFLGDDMLRYMGVGEEVLCPGNGPPADPDKYQQLVDHLARNRIGYENHASSGAAQEAYLDHWEKANQIEPISELHWTIAHPGEDGESPTPETLARAKALGVGMEPTDGGALGRPTSPPYKRMYDSGIRMCIATDAMNVAPFPPFVNLWYVVSGETFDPDVPGVPPDQRLTRTEALRSATTNCGWFLDQEGRVGSIEPGNHADLIVLTDDYFEVPTDQIRNIRSVLTMVGGRIVHSSGPFAELEED